MLIVTTTARRQAREDDAWIEGYNEREEEWEEFVADKDAFIAEQSALIARLMDVLDTASDATGRHIWAYVPDDLRTRLADYV